MGLEIHPSDGRILNILPNKQIGFGNLQPEGWFIYKIDKEFFNLSILNKKMIGENMYKLELKKLFDNSLSTDNDEISSGFTVEKMMKIIHLNCDKELEKKVNYAKNYQDVVNISIAESCFTGNDLCTKFVVSCDSLFFYF